MKTCPTCSADLPPGHFLNCEVCANLDAICNIHSPIETPGERAERKSMHMAQLSRYGKGMESAEDIKTWEKKWEDANKMEQ